METMRKLGRRFSSTGFVTLFFGLISLHTHCNRPPAGSQAEQERVVAAIQAFRQQHGRLPDTFEEARIDFDRSIFDHVIYAKDIRTPNKFAIICYRSYWSPTPREHCWHYSSEHDSWEYNSWSAD